MNIILIVITGFIIGLIARAIVPGKRSLGIIRTTLLGIAGSFVGGFIGHTIEKGPQFISDFITQSLEKGSQIGWIGSVIGAIVLLFIIERRSK